MDWRDLAIYLISTIIGMLIAIGAWMYTNLRTSIGKIWDDRNETAKSASEAALLLEKEVAKKDDFNEYRRRTEVIEKGYIDREYLEKSRIEWETRIDKSMALQLEPIKGDVRTILQRLDKINGNGGSHK